MFTNNGLVNKQQGILKNECYKQEMRYIFYTLLCQWLLTGSNFSHVQDISENIFDYCDLGFLLTLVG